MTRLEAKTALRGLVPALGLSLLLTVTAANAQAQNKDLSSAVATAPYAQTPIAQPPMAPPAQGPMERAPAAGSAAAGTPPPSGGRASKSLSFEDDVVEGMNRDPLDTLQQVSHDESKNQGHLYRKRTEFQTEIRQTVQEAGYAP